MTKRISAELADAVHKELRNMKEKYDLTWSEFFGVMAALDGPPGEVARAAREASQSADGASSSAAAYGAAVYVVGGRDDAGEPALAAGSAPEQPTAAEPEQSAATEPEQPTATEPEQPATAASEQPTADTAGPAATATDGGAPATAAAVDWDAGLSGPEREIVEALVDALQDEGDAVSDTQLDYQIPVQYMGDVGIADVSPALAKHPDVEQVGDGTFVYNG